MAIKAKTEVGGAYSPEAAVGIGSGRPAEFIDVPVVPSANPAKCTVNDLGESCGMLVSFYIGPLESKRLRMRAQTMPLDRYLYENILFRAISDHVY